MDPLTPEEVTALVKRAHATISDLCHQRKRWVMSIPARPDEDPDLIISAALRAQTDTIRDRERERDDKEYARKEWAETAQRVIMERDELQRKLEECERRLNG